MSEDGEGGRAERVVRLLFRYRDGVPELVSRQTVEMVLPEEDDPPAADGGAALAFELRDARHRPLLARSLDHHVHTSHEVFSPQSLERVADPRPSGAFEVLVPDLPGAEFGALVSADPALGAAMGAGELVFRLADIPEDVGMDEEGDDEGGGR